MAALREPPRKSRWTARRPRRNGTGFGGSGAPQPMLKKIARRLVAAEIEPIGRRGRGQLGRRRVEVAAAVWRNLPSSPR